ncbi:MAG: hypothetical protein ABIS92_13165 [Polyangia bacterium]
MPTNVGNLTVFGSIEDKWIQLGGLKGALGAPTSNEAATFDGAGRAQSFANGVVSWHPKTGANAIWGAIGKRWLAIGRENFGYPITDENACADGAGRFNHFRGLHLAGTPDSSIFWSPLSGAHEVYGAIRGKWAELGWERGPAGYPTEPERARGVGGRSQAFQRAVITWTGQVGAIQHEGVGDHMSFESGPVTSNLPLGGRIRLVVRRNGDFVFSGHAHGSGFSNIDYAFGVVLATAAGTAYTFAHKGHVEGTSGTFPSAPNRNSDFTRPGNSPAIASDWDNLLVSGRMLPPNLSGEDKLLGGLQDLLADAAKQIGAAAIKAAVTALAA